MALIKAFVYILTFSSLNYHFSKANEADNQFEEMFELNIPASLNHDNQKIVLHVQTKLKNEIIDALRPFLEKLLAGIAQQQVEIKELTKEIVQQHQQCENSNKAVSDTVKELLAEHFSKCQQEMTKIHEDSQIMLQKTEVDVSQNIAKLEKGQSTLKIYAADILNGRLDSSYWDENFNCVRGCAAVKPLPASCEEAMKICHNSGIYLLQIPGSGLPPFYANCKCIDNKIWTIVQRREDGSVDFFRRWYEYKQGFGRLDGELWLGLERLHHLTKRQPHELYIWMESKNGTRNFANYKKFQIADEAEKYKLTIGEFSGSSVDGFDDPTKPKHWSSNEMNFSTWDECNDKSDCEHGLESCAKGYQGAWWFNACYISHLNGLYNGEDSKMERGIVWGDADKHLKYTQMAIRQISGFSEVVEIIAN